MPSGEISYLCLRNAYEKSCFVGYLIVTIVAQFSDHAQETGVNLALEWGIRKSTPRLLLCPNNDPGGETRTPAWIRIESDYNFRVISPKVAVQRVTTASSGMDRSIHRLYSRRMRD